MAGDWVKHLIVRAGCENVIDFRNADVRSPHWWRYASLKLRYLYDKTNTEIDNLVYPQMLANLASGQFAGDDFNNLSSKISDRVREMACNHQPWLRKQREDRYKKMGEDYRRLVGDPNNPADRARWEADSEKFAERLSRATREQETKDNEIRRRMAERDNEVKIEKRPVIEVKG